MKHMKLHPMTAGAFALQCLICQTASAQSTVPSVPVGELSAFPTIVQTGTKPLITWKIYHPSVVKNYVTVSPNTTSSPSNTTITPTTPLSCVIRILGLGVTSKNSSGGITYYRTRGRMRFNGSSTWVTIYDGKQTDTIVQRQEIVKPSFTVNMNQPIYFAGAYYNNGWQTEYTSLVGDNVRILVNGDTCPSNIPDYNAPSLESFLKPYLDTSKKVRIGPMDVIAFMELTHTDKSNVGYDLQDYVMLLTFNTL